MTWTAEDVAKYVGRCPVCGEPWTVEDVDAEMLNTSHWMQRRTGSGLRDKIAHDACAAKATEAARMEEEMELRQQRRRDLDASGAWPRWAQQCRFEGSDPAIEAENKARKEAYRQARQWRPGAENLWISSAAAGNGKTYLACCLANVAFDAGIDPMFLSAANVEHLAKGYDSGEKLERPSRAGILVLDDVDKADSDRAPAALFAILDSRNNRGLNTIVTANCSAKELVDSWMTRGGHMRKAIDRMSWPNYTCRALKLTGKSLRTRGGNRQMEMG